MSEDARAAAQAARSAARQPVLQCFSQLDDEAFDFLVSVMTQTADARGGFRDKAGLAALATAGHQYLDARADRRRASPPAGRKGPSGA